MKHKFIIIISSLLLLLFILTACRQLDVIANGSISSFKEIIDVYANHIKDDTSNASWSLSAPDKSARFIWSKDISGNSAYDVMITFDAAPFIKAGLDIHKLPKEMVYDDNIIIGIDLGGKSSAYNGNITPLDSYEQIVDLHRDLISYHTHLDHYGIDLGNGNMFEWAKDIRTNDKDIVFVLNPTPFIEAGVDPEKVDGWVFAKVETMDKSGKNIEVDKLLKSFSID